MQAVHWLRVVLDEAQYIKEHTTQVSRAVRGLKAERRWGALPRKQRKEKKRLRG